MRITSSKLVWESDLTICDDFEDWHPKLNFAYGLGQVCYDYKGQAIAVKVEDLNTTSVWDAPWQINSAFI